VKAGMKPPNPIKKRTNDLKYQEKNKEQINLARTNKYIG
jgi:hypothetical protein